jgi:hypothetical protein
LRVDVVVVVVVKRLGDYLSTLQIRQQAGDEGTGGDEMRDAARTDSL